MGDELPKELKQVLVDLAKIPTADLPVPPSIFTEPAAGARDFFAAPSAESPSDAPLPPLNPEPQATAQSVGNGNTFELRDLAQQQQSGNPTELLQQILSTLQEIRQSMAKEIASELGYT